MNTKIIAKKFPCVRCGFEMLFFCWENEAKMTLCPTCSQKMFGTFVKIKTKK